MQRLSAQGTEVVTSWFTAPVVAAYQALRGVGRLTAVTFVAAIGDVRRFNNPRQLMAFRGLVPTENSTGERVRRGGITKAGDNRVRCVLIDGVWTHRLPARMSTTLEERQDSLPRVVHEIALKPQLRLCGRYRRLLAAGNVRSDRGHDGSGSRNVGVPVGDGAARRTGQLTNRHSFESALVIRRPFIDN
jgi:transposase